METQINNEKEESWDDVLSAPVGHIFRDKFDEGLRFIVMRGPAALCAYIGVPLDHPLAGNSYDDIPINCHGGLTYNDKGGDAWPDGYWWYGWDYAHAGDACGFSPSGISMIHGDDTKWTPSMVESDAWDARYEFKKLMRLAEKVSTAKARV
jgi:hypothetical protein